MGSILSLLCGQPNYHWDTVLVLGLPKSGTTEFTNSIVSEPVVRESYHGLDMDVVEGDKITVRNCSMDALMRNNKARRALLKTTFIVAFVVDASDPASFDEVSEKLEWLRSKVSRHASIVVYGNKQDLLRHADGVEAAVCKGEVYQPCTATTGDGIIEGIQKMVERQKASLL